MIFPRLTNTQNILLWANQLIGVLERNRNEIFSSFARQDTGGTVRLDGRIQVNQTASDPDVSTDAIMLVQIVFKASLLVVGRISTDG